MSIPQHGTRGSAPKLALDIEEREALEHAGVSLRHLADWDARDLATASGLDLGRCLELVALAGFQTLGSVGPESARDLWLLGFHSVEELRDADPSAMYNRINALAKQRVDPCVEDVFRCAVAQARYPDLSPELRQWWSWKHQRGSSTVTLPSEGEPGR